MLSPFVVCVKQNVSMTVKRITIIESMYRGTL